MFSTRKYNPREATKDSLKDVREQFQKTSGGLVRNRPEYAIYMGIRLHWIQNLEEIREYRSDSGLLLPRAKWTPEARKETAELLNGNHRFKLLQEQLSDQMEQLRDVRRRKMEFADEQQQKKKISKKRREQNERDIELEKQLKEVLYHEGLFSVKLFDLGK